MKKYGSTIQILSLACACLIIAGSATQSGAANAPPNSGHLLVYRAAKVWLSPQPCVVSRWEGCGKPFRGPNLRWLLAGGPARPCRSSYSQHHRCACGATNGDDTSWPHLLLHRSFVGKEFGVGKKK